MVFLITRALGPPSLLDVDIRTQIIVFHAGPESESLAVSAHEKLFSKCFPNSKFSKFGLCISEFENHCLIQKHYGSE